MSSNRDGMARLEVFVGRWDVAASFPMLGNVDLRGQTEFEWMLDRRFLLQRASVSHPDAPDLVAIIGEDASGGYTQHYFDSRGIARTYAMTFDGRVWTMARDSADFSPLEFAQRFIGTFNDSGDEIRCRFEIRHGGRDWEHDFDLTYMRAGGS